MQTRFDVVIVGAGHSGAQAAITLRQQKFSGTIAIVGDETDPPYERPPLSKDYLKGDKTFDRLQLRSVDFWKYRQIDLLLGRSAVSVDALRHSLELEDGSHLGYRQLVWAAGGRPRRMTCAGSDLAGIHHIRTRVDVDRLRSELPTTQSVVVIGGGYIGLEAAAVLVEQGKQVTVVEVLDRVLARVAGEPLSLFYQAEHRSHGVRFRLDSAVDCLIGKDGRVAGVRLADGELLPADVVIVGIGIVPAVEPLMAAGARGENGVDVDHRCATTLPDIYAIGDCARHANDFSQGGKIRLESVQNANDQAMVAAKNIVGQDVEYHATPWFWSNQYDLKLQTIGLSLGHDSVVVRGDPTNRSFSLVYLKDERVVALDCVNAMKDFIQGRALVEAKSVIAPEKLGDADKPLKTLLEQEPDPVSLRIPN